jgi:hypothetical protein
VTTIPALAPAPAPLARNPLLSAAVQQQTSVRDAFMARPAIPLGAAASPRDGTDDEQALADDAQCIAIGAAPSRLSVSVLRPAIDWWWR